MSKIESVSIPVSNIKRSIQWYRDNFECELISENKISASLQFENIKLVLLLPIEEPPHLTIETSDLRTHVNGQLEHDGHGNFVKIIKEKPK